MRHLIVGLVLLILGAWGMITWWFEFGAVLRGLIPVLLALFGLTAIGAGFKKWAASTESEHEEADEPGGGTLVYPKSNRMAG